MPPSVPMSTVAMPILSEMRPPKSTRDHTSLPRAVVPNQLSALGPSSGGPTANSLGGEVLSTGAARASTTTRTINPKPSAPNGSRRAHFSGLNRWRGGIAYSSASASAETGASASGAAAVGSWDMASTESLGQRPCT